MRLRRGMTLLEIMVVVAIMVVLLGVGVPSLQGIFDLEQRGVARELGLTYKFLINEAMMRNVAFRIAYDLDQGSYKIEVGDPDSLVFGDPESREAWEEEQERAMKRLSKSEKEEAAEEEMTSRFAGLTMPGFQTSVELPAHTSFAWVYTPQYAEPQTPTEERDRREGDPNKVVYSYIFADGQAEYTVVRIASRNDAEDGYTVEVEPLSGNVRVDSEIRDIGASLQWSADGAPTSL